MKTHKHTRPHAATHTHTHTTDIFGGFRLLLSYDKNVPLFIITSDTLYGVIYCFVFSFKSFYEELTVGSHMFNGKFTVLAAYFTINISSIHKISKKKKKYEIQ